jgi:hypothetical protein
MVCEDAAVREAFADWTWHIVPCVDPDGTRLNEGWFKGPFTRSNYARHFYRPRAEDQVEWTFPFAYKQAYFDQVLPETLALMRLIDDVKPAFLCSLHNAEAGGVYYYLSHEAPDVYAPLQEIPAHYGLPLDLGEPEVPWVPVLAPGIFGRISRSDGYDFLEQAGQDPTAIRMGESSINYALRHGTFSLVSELPYWSDPNADDQTPTDQPYAAVLARQADDLAEVGGILRGVLAQAGPHLTVETPFLRAIRGFTDNADEQVELARWRSSQDENARPATVAERWSCRGLVHLYRTRFGGILLRALAAQIDTGLAAPPVRLAHAELLGRFEEWCAEAEAETAGSMIPIRSLSGTQLGAIFACLKYLERASQ